MYFLVASPFTPLRGAAVVTNLFQLFAHLVSQIAAPAPKH